MIGLEQKIRDDGLLPEGELSVAVEQAERTRQPLADVLVARGLLSEPTVLGLLGALYGLPFVTIDDWPVDREAVRSVPAKLASHYGVMPLKLEGAALTLAVSNPLDMAAAEDLETNHGLRIERVLACRADIRNALRRHYGVGADTVERILADTAARERQPAGEESHDLERMAEDASVVKLVNQLLQEAIQQRATDIHFEMQRDGVVTRRRIDGVLYDARIPKNMTVLYPAIVSRIKLMASLNIVERRLPQDGRARVRVGGEEYDLRISVVPAVHGEDIVVRILPAAMLFNLAQLGFSDGHQRLIEGLIARPHGILFVTGPTGSGKSTTLYACLSRLNTRERKIITIEDPVEYELSGITQTQINPRIGLTFAAALRSMLRHDPDVMMVGEVRDRETAEIAVQTAMTGHLVFSTLHTNDAASAAARLLDMGVEPFLLTSTVLAFAAQRLVRLICPHCRETREEEGRLLYRGAGCRQCGQTGYRGRLAICEVLPLEPSIQDLILKRASARAIREEADRLGMQTLLADGWAKVERGQTTREELLRVTSA